jgi:hypothetical protein
MFDIPIQALMGQLLIGLINGSFYALLSLGLAVIFGLLNIINFAHGAFYMMGAFGAYLLLSKLGLNYWWSLIVAPVVVGAIGVVLERTMLKRLYQLDHLYGLLLTFGLALSSRAVPQRVRLSGLPYAIPAAAGRAEPGLHVPAQLPRLGHRGLAGGVPGHLVRDRAHAAGRLPARGHREPAAGAGLRHQRAAHGHADLRLRRGAGRAGRRAGRAHLPGQPADGRTSSSSCSPWW